MKELTVQRFPRKKYFTTPDRGFRWRDRTGKFHRPEDMETRHLFYTLRMIWNHTMPEGYQTQYRNHYIFTSFYTEAYMVEAVYAVGNELFSRNDLTPSMKNTLDFMASRFKDATYAIESRRKSA
jgi:hypothetical protein